MRLPTNLDGVYSLTLKVYIFKQLSILCYTTPFDTN
jgi:hypothetical protein